LWEVEIDLPAWAWSQSSTDYENIDFEDLSDEEIKALTTQIMEEAVDTASSVWDSEMLLEASKTKIDYVLEVPWSLLPDELSSTERYWIRSNELYPESPRFDVEKTFMDVNWWNDMFI